MNECFRSFDKNIFIGIYAGLRDVIVHCFDFELKESQEDRSRMIVRISAIKLTQFITNVYSIKHAQSKQTKIQAIKI